MVHQFSKTDNWQTTGWTALCHLSPETHGANSGRCYFQACGGLEGDFQVQTVGDQPECLPCEMTGSVNEGRAVNLF